MAQRNRDEIISALEQKGFQLKSKKQHFKYAYIYQNLTEPIFTIISHGTAYKVYRDTLLSKMSKQLKLNNKQLLSFIDCPVTKEEYLKILKELNIIRE